MPSRMSSSTTSSSRGSTGPSMKRIISTRATSSTAINRRPSTLPPTSSSPRNPATLSASRRSPWVRTGRSTRRS
jgi:hypothetical protein